MTTSEEAVNHAKPQQPGPAERARSARRVRGLRAALVGGAVATSLAATGAIVATAQSGDTTRTTATTGSSSTSSDRSSTSSSLATTGSGTSHATTSGS